MKLELVMLTTVISVITERQVEAQLKCFEKRDRTGKSVTISASIQDVTNQFPNGPKACDLPPNSGYIFYSDVDFTGNVNTMFSKNGEVYHPRSRFQVKSIYVLGQLSPDGVHLFLRQNFQGGSVKSFSKKNDKVTDGSPFLSAVVIGSVDWTISRNCSDKTCDTCLKADKQGGASFIQDIKNGVLEKVTSVSRATCSGINYVGRPSIPECPCNPHGVVDGPDKCKGTNGICKCKTNHTGDDCDSCNATLTWREGQCVAGCGCYPPGVENNDMTCSPSNSKDGTCNCNWRMYYEGEKCDKCEWVAYQSYDGKCLYPKCIDVNMIMDGKPPFGLYDGHCRCKPRYLGLCDTCREGFFKFEKKCLTKAEFDLAKELREMRDKSIDDDSKLFKILDGLQKLGVLTSRFVTERKKAVWASWVSANEAAEYVIRHQTAWLI